MNKFIKLKSVIDESIEKRKLEKAISEKEKELNTLIEKVEQLKIDLTVVKQEYDIKVGRLYLRLDELDLEILKFKKIEDLINKGFSFKEAQKIVEETLQKKQEQIKEEYKKLDEEETEIENRRSLSESEKEELKKLYYKLAHQYHPDKSGGNEEIMKKINEAYAKGDIETLRAIDQAGSRSRGEKGQTIKALRVKLVELEMSIEKVRQEYEELKKSEWYILKQNIEKARRQGRDILNELADKLLSDIAKKENRVKELKEKYGQG